MRKIVSIIGEAALIRAKLSTRNYKMMWMNTAIDTRSREFTRPMVQTERREKLKKRHVSWLKGLMDATGVKAHKIAEEAGISASTLYNVLDKDMSSVLSADTIDKITVAFSYHGPDAATSNGQAAGFREPEALKLEPEVASKECRPKHPGQSVWRLQTRALELPPYGYQPGDEVLIDDHVAPKPQDVVCANTATGETVWRVFVPPYYLLTATADTNIPPTPLINQHDATIMGVVIRSVRCRKPKAG